MGTASRLHLSLAAEAENVALARARVGDFAAELGYREPLLGDLKTIVSEACTNVVRHAYPDHSRGRFELEAVPDAKELALTVRDFGQGMRARIPVDDSSLRLGLGLISMLSESFEICGGDGGGTEILVRLPLPAGEL